MAERREGGPNESGFESAEELKELTAEVGVETESDAATEEQEDLKALEESLRKLGRSWKNPKTIHTCKNPGIIAGFFLEDYPTLVKAKEALGLILASKPRWWERNLERAAEALEILNKLSGGAEAVLKQRRPSYEAPQNWRG